MTADRQDYGGVRDRHQHENTRVGCYSGKNFSLPVIVSLRASFSIGGVARSHALTARKRRSPSKFRCSLARSLADSTKLLKFGSERCYPAKYQYFTDGSF